jgi:hypothetical protein
LAALLHPLAVDENAVPAIQILNEVVAVVGDDAGVIS